MFLKFKINKFLNIYFSSENDSLLSANSMFDISFGRYMIFDSLALSVHTVKLTIENINFGIQEYLGSFSKYCEINSLDNLMNLNKFILSLKNNKYVIPNIISKF